MWYLFVNNNQYLRHVVDNIIFRISVPNYPSRTVENNSLRLYCNLVYYLYFIFIKLTISLHMTNSKVRNSDSTYSYSYSQVILKMFTFLINTADKEIYNNFNSFLFLFYFNINRTNKQTNTQAHKHKSSLNIKDKSCLIHSVPIEQLQKCSIDCCFTSFSIE